MNSSFVSYMAYKDLTPAQKEKARAASMRSWKKRYAAQKQQRAAARAAIDGAESRNQELYK